MEDYLLKNGTIVDGSREEPYRGSISIKDGKIHSITTDDSEFRNHKNIIDVEGKIIAPGFIDIHSHSDSRPLPPEQAQSKLFQGVTTEIVGNCGGSALPKTINEDNIEEFLLKSTFDKKPINQGMLIGQGTLRGRIVGYDDREATEEEIQQMGRFLDRALKGGAFGLSLGLIYSPGIFSTTDELIALAKVVKENDGILSVHMRSESEKIFQALDEVLYITEQTGVHLNISHLKLIGKQQWNKSDLLLERIERARKKGLSITCDQYPFDATSTGLSAMMPKWMHDGGREKMLERLNNVDEELIRALKESLERKDGPTNIRVVGTSGKMVEAEGKNILEISQLMRLSPERTIIELLIKCNGRVSVVFHTLNMNDVLNIMKDMNITVGSDGSAFSFNREITTTSPHPRNFATFPRFLQTVRENNLMPIEDVVYKITKLPANILRLDNRGELTEGMVADITVFDYENIKDNSSYNNSVVKPSGISHVFVKGVPEILDGIQQYRFSGKLLLKSK